MKIFLIALCTLVALNQCTGDLDSEWAKYKQDYKRNYSEAEDKIHKAIFAETLAKVNAHQEKFKRGEVSFEMGLNHFSDMDTTKFKKEFTKGVPFDPVYGRASRARNVTARSAPPASVNWVKNGFNSPVLQQGDCGCCYTFAAIAALEGQYFIKYKKLIKLSEQELLSCTRDYGNFGCGGGWQRNIYEYMLENGGVGYEKDHPYVEAEEEECSRSKPRVTIKNYYEIPEGDEEALKAAVANVGPIPIDMDNSLDSFKDYKSGVYYDEDCDTHGFGHAMTVVGYGTTDKGEDYWLVRNSWDSDWGENGYIRMARNRDNHCGVATRAVYPVLN